MAKVAFPWRPLGSLLVEKGLIDEAQLEKALKTQRRDGRTLGEILVERGWVTPFGLAAALASQHGLKVSLEDGAPEEGGTPELAFEESGEGWKPLGRLLVQRGLLTEVQLKQALAEQHGSGSRLGDILVGRGWVAASAIAATVAAQHGLKLDGEAVLRARPSAEPLGEVRFVVREPSAEGWQDLHVSPSFLDATDAAFDALDEREPEALVIVRVEPGNQEVVWRYLADEVVQGERDTLLDLYGYPAVEWNAAPWLDDARNTGNG
jgi:hypothetical protein